MFIISAIPNIVNRLTGQDVGGFFIGFFVALILSFLQILILIGLIKISLDVVCGKTENPKIKELFSHANLLIKYVLASSLRGLISTGPIILILLLYLVSSLFNFGTIVQIILAFMGIIALVFMIIYSIRLSYYPYFIVEGSGIIESLKNSYKITKGMVWSLMVLGFVLGLINLLGVLCLFVGLLVTVPISYVASAYVYKKLKEANSSLLTEIKDAKINTPITPETK